MADLQSILKKIDSLRAELDSFKPLKQEDNERLWKKFRLEWNFNSNHIEGNTLTYRKTELLLIFDKTTDDHEMREYEEMKAHDVAIKLIQEYAKDSSRALIEANVRELNKIILVRPYWSDAQTPDGQATKREIIPGEYKKQPNSVRLQNGEMFHYASPEETPAKMAELIEWYRKAETEKKLHPLELAAKIHYDFVRIHPFDDSNGRTSRLLMNYVLLRHGFPPVIIKSADKKNYLTALNKADVGDLDSFIEYVGKQLVWSLEVNIKAAKGESIEEDEDLYKEIEIWERSIRKVDSNEPVNQIESLKDIFLKYLIPFFSELKSRYGQFDKLFTYSQIYVIESTPGLKEESEKIRDIEEIKQFFLERIKKYNELELSAKSYHVWTIQFLYEGFRSKLDKKTYFISSIQIDIDALVIEIKSGEPKKTQKVLWLDKMIDFDISEIVKKCVAEDFELIKKLER
jgi:Fic family protein